MNAFATQTSLPREIFAHLSKETGLELSEVESEAESIWSMLTELRESNPDAYRDFVKKQVEEGASNHGKSSRYFTPEKGFVVQLKLKDRGDKIYQKLYINFCKHNAIAKPLDRSGKPATDTSELQNLQIPLAVSRYIRPLKHDGEENLVVDIVFHPWCLEKAESSSWFKQKVVDLAVTWFQREHADTELEKGWFIVKSKYYGGEGHKMNEVARFFVPDELLNGRGGDPDDKKKLGRESKSIPHTHTCNLTTPGSLITLLNENEEAENKEPAEPVASLVLPGGGNSENLKKKLENIDAPTPLIEEIVNDSWTDSKHRNNEYKQSSKKAGIIKRGFLNGCKKRAPLYKSGSSSGAGTGDDGSYAKLMSKCNLIDTSSMMKGNKDTHNTKNKCIDDFLMNLHSRSDKSNELSGTFDAEFEKICHIIDLGARPENAGVETADLLSKLDSALGQNPDDSARVENIHRAASANQKMSSLDSIPFSLKTADGADIIKIDFSEQPAILNITDIDLSVSEVNLVITSPTCTGRVNIALSRRVDANQIVAKFRKNRRILTVSIPY